MDWFLLVPRNGGKRVVARKGVVETKYGKIDLTNAKPGDVVKTEKGTEFVVLEASQRDLYIAMKRGPQIILPEIMGIIISETMPGRDWRIVEAGGGSGYATYFLSWLCREGRVYVYEKNEKHFKILVDNIKKLGLDNVVARNKDVMEMEETGLDLILLDMKGPERFVEKAFSSLKPGRFLVVYSPQIEQVIAVRKAIEESGLSMECKTLEAIIRNWKVDTRGYTHPNYKNLSHTGFITVCRRIG